MIRDVMHFLAVGRYREARLLVRAEAAHLKARVARFLRLRVR